MARLKIKPIDRTKLMNKLVSSRRDLDRPIYNWHVFKHAYSKDLVEEIISTVALKAGAWVLDPFCGGGTTLLACRENGINSIGYDISPYAVFLSKAKLDEYSLSDIDKQMKLFQKVIVSQDKFPPKKIQSDIPTLHTAFSESTWGVLISIKEFTDHIELQSTRNLFLLALLGILEGVSNTRKAGAFLRVVKKTVRQTKVIDDFVSKLVGLKKDIEVARQTTFSARSEVIEGDARSLRIDKKFDAVITSPPYPNRHDYTRTYLLELGFGFTSFNSQLKQLRYRTLRSHVEARLQQSSDDYKQPESLTRILNSISQKPINNRAIVPMLGGYFEDMYLSLDSLYRTLKPGGWAVMTVGNVRYAGVNVPVDELLCEIGLQVGLHPEYIWAARLKGNSSQQMRRYERRPSRESVIFWRR